MKIISKTIKMLPLFMLCIGLISCSSDDDGDSQVIEDTTVVDIAIANDFTSLAAALEAADLVTTLQGEGPFTVFAPTNQAFQDLLDSNDNWNALSDIPTETLRTVLLNHVIIESDIDAATFVSAGSGYQSVGSTGPDNSNLSIYFNVVNGTVELNGGANAAVGADVTVPDLEADNGRVHVVNKVLLPPSIVDFALANPALSNLVASLQLADSQEGTDLIGTLSGNGPFTVLAPTNTAFAELLVELDPSGETELADLDPATVEGILLLHVIGDNVRSSELSTDTVATLNGNIDINASELTITDPRERVSNLVPGLIDIQGTNGVVHVIDQVLLPEEG